MQSIPLSQYLCSKCGSILCETAADIEISSVKEECPNCGTLLAQSLTKRSNEQRQLLQTPKLQTAYDLYRFRFGIEKIDSVMRLGTAGSLCVIGCKANLILARLIVRALMPGRFGGLDSPYVMVVDAGNKSDLYQTVAFVRQYHMNIDDSLDRIIVNRPFTIHQLKKLIVTQVPKDIQQYQLKVIIIPGLLDLFDDDPNIKKKEAKRVVERIMKAMQALSERVLIITSVQEGKYANLVVPKFEKHIVLNKTKNNRLAAVLDKKSVTLTERELKIAEA